MVDRRFINGASVLALALALTACAHAPASIQPLAETAPVEDTDATRGHIVETPAPVVRPQPPPPAPAPERGASQRREPRGLPAIRAAYADALAPSRGDSFLNGVQVFSYEPGRIFEIYTTPLRVTVISLRPGERIVSMVAGDTVRWQIAETTSGTGADARSHVVLKPLRQGLTTNLVLTTSERVYMIALRATSQTDAFNAAVAWEYPDAFNEADLETLLVTEGARAAPIPDSLGERGTLLALAAGKSAAAMLFGLQPYDALSVSIAVAGLALVALLASYVPALRAARVDPLTALREE